MSSQSITSEQSTKKRKYEGDTQDTKKKKRKNEEAVDAQHGIDAAKAAKKEKKKKDRANEESRDGNTLAASQVDITESTLTTEKKKKKKKSQEQEVVSQSALENATTLADSRIDIEMVYEPILEGGPGEIQVKDTADAEEGAVVSDQLQSTEKSSFQAIRMSLYLPVPAIASSNILSALLTVHVSPLLLTFFPPAGGVILSYHDPVLSAVPQSGAGRPSLPPSKESGVPDSEVYATVGEEFGASWVWLTITLLVFKPETGSELTGFINAMSEGFIGLVSYNYFQASIPRNRIPKDWTWSGPSRQKPRHKMIARKGVLNDSDEPSQETLVDLQEQVREDDAADGIAGSFHDADGNQVSEDLKFRVVDLEMIQAQERGRQFALQLEGTLLDEEGERQIREEEKLKWEARMIKQKSKPGTPGTPLMSGGLPTHSRAGSIVSRV